MSPDRRRVCGKRAGDESSLIAPNTGAFRRRGSLEESFMDDRYALGLDLGRVTARDGLTGKRYERMFDPMERLAIDIRSDKQGARTWRLKKPIAAVPEVSAASRYAELLRASIDGDDARHRPLPHLDAFCAATGMVITTASLRGAAGGVQATIAPLHGDRFHVVVDPEPLGGWSRFESSVRDDLRRQRYRFRLAHELAHTFFYDRSGAEPRRRILLTKQEEIFCDHFARGLLLPDEALRGCKLSPRSVIALQQRFDVSLETAVRGVAAVRSDVFLGLLVANGAHAPHLRPQWQSDGVDLPPRWWAAEWLQSALVNAPSGDQLGLIGHGRSIMRCIWRVLPTRKQVLVVAGQP